MKNPFFKILMLMLTLAISGQMTASTYVNMRDVCGLATPMEEAADEDSDNEGETDKIFQTIDIENTELSYSVSHNSFFEANLSELIQEIVPPPPKG